jgi:hypothetical protein
MFCSSVVTKGRTAFAKARQVNRSTNVEPKLIAFERRLPLVAASCLGPRTEVKEVARVQGIVSQKLEKLTVKIVRTRARRDVTRWRRSSGRTRR